MKAKLYTLAILLNCIPNQSLGLFVVNFGRHTDIVFFVKKDGKRAAGVRLRPNEGIELKRDENPFMAKTCRIERNVSLCQERDIREEDAIAEASGTVRSTSGGTGSPGSAKTPILVSDLPTMFTTVTLSAALPGGTSYEGGICLHDLTHENRVAKPDGVDWVPPMSRVSCLG